MHLNPELTAHQQQILVLLAQGKSITAAAEAVGVHRNTVANWRRSSESFRNHWHNMQYEQAMYWRDELQTMAPIAVNAILQTLTDEKTPPSVRLRAALAVLDKVTAVAPAQPGLNLSTDKGVESPAMHNHAQSAQPTEPAAEPVPAEPVTAEPVIPEPVINAEPFEIVFPEDSSVHDGAAQSCTTWLDELLDSMRYLDDDGVADLLDHVTGPPPMPVPESPVHNLAQCATPGESRSGSSNPGSRDSS